MEELYQVALGNYSHNSQPPTSGSPQPLRLSHKRLVRPRHRGQGPGGHTCNCGVFSSGHHTIVQCGAFTTEHLTVLLAQTSGIRLIHVPCSSNREEGTSPQHPSQLWFSSQLSNHTPGRMPPRYSSQLYFGYHASHGAPDSRIDRDNLFPVAYLQSVYLESGLRIPIPADSLYSFWKGQVIAS